MIVLGIEGNLKVLRQTCAQGIVCQSSNCERQAPI